VNGISHRTTERFQVGFHVCTSARLHVCTSARLHVCTSARLPSHRLIVSSSHRLIVSSSHRLIVSSSHRLIVSFPTIPKHWVGEEKTSPTSWIRLGFRVHRTEVDFESVKRCACWAGVTGERNRPTSLCLPGERYALPPSWLWVSANGETELFSRFAVMSKRPEPC